MNAAGALVVAIFLVAFLERLFPSSSAWRHLVLSPWFVWDRGEVWRLVTYSFLHSPDSLWHAALNGLGLWVFGRPVASALGALRFLAFYLVCAVVAGLFAVGWPLVVRIAGLAQIDPFVETIGASGAVLGVITASLVGSRRRAQTGRMLFLALALIALSVVLTPQRTSTSSHLGGITTALVARGAARLRAARRRALPPSPPLPARAP